MKTIKTYRICVSAHLDHGWEDYFKSYSVSIRFDLKMNPVTVFKLRIEDQANLYGVISKLRDLGMTLIHLNQIEMEERDGENYEQVE